MKISNYLLSLHKLRQRRLLQNCKKNQSIQTPEIKWTSQQLEVLAAVTDRKSIFITGSGGTGKTFLLQHIIKGLKRIYKPSRVFATASTGVAACHIEGQTLHSFAGIGSGQGDRDSLLDKVFRDKKALKRWKNVDALIIDECSMIDAELFDHLQFIARNVRSVNKPWGGIKLIVSGDFFQLPPVDLKTKGFAFEAECWNLSFDFQIELTEVFRQPDPRLIKLLQGIRIGKSDSDDIRLLEEHFTDAKSDPSIVRIYPRREDVEKTNREHFTYLNGERVTYEAFDYGSRKYSGIISDEVELCVGARVMLNKNINLWRKLVNGATGTIIGFSVPKKECLYKLVPTVKFDSGEVVDIYPEEWDVIDGDKKATRKQIPLILAWALSIHKCQGMSLDRVHTDLTRAFDYGMVYVALSRVKTLEGLHLSRFDPSKIKVHPKVVKFYESLHRAAYLAKVINAHVQVR